MRVYRAAGYTISYPWEARIDTAEANDDYAKRVEIIGEPIQVIAALWKHSDDTVRRQAASYTIRLDEVANSTHRSLRAVVDSIVSHMDGPPGADDAAMSKVTLDSIRVAGELGYVLDIPCGDCARYDVYFERAGRIVRIGWSMDDDDILWGTARPMFWFVVSSFRWQSPL